MKPITWHCLLIAVVAVASAGAQTPTDLAGSVVDVTGAGIAGARVRVEVSGVAVAAVVTVSDGSFRIPEVPSEGAVIVVKAAGFNDVRVRVSETGDPGRLRIVLQPAGIFETVTVTASRTDLIVAPVAGVVLTSAQLATQAAPVIDDVLRNSAGFGLARRSSSRVANPSSQGVTMRGLPGNAGSRTLVLADGLPLNDQFGGWVYWNRVPEAAVERVEVVRGASGDLYGGDAVGGVVQLLTFGPGTPRARALFEAGTARTARASVFAGGQRHGWNGSAAGEWVRTDGEPIVAEAERGPVDVPAFSNYATQFLSGGYSSATWRLRVRGWWYQEARGNGTRLVTNDTNWRRLSTEAGGDLAGGTWSLQASAGRQRYFNNFSTVPVGRRSERLTSEQRIPSRFNSASGQWVRPWPSVVLLMGAEAKHTEATVSETKYAVAGAPSGPFITGGRETVASVYGRALTTPAPSLTVVTGLRADFWRSDPRERTAARHSVNFFSPRLSIAWKLSQAVTLRGAAVRAYRTPTLDELHRDSAIGNTLTYANPLLGPERLTGLDAGVALAHPRLSVRVNVFWNDLTDAVTNVTLGVSANRLEKQKQNAETVRAKGVELEADVRPFSSLTVSASGQFTSSRFRNEVKAPALEGRRVPQVPAFAANAAVVWTSARVATFSVQLRTSGVQYEDDLNTLPLDGFAVVDVRAGRSITRALHLYAACENLLDSKYATGRTGNPPITRVGWPRSVRVGIRLSIPRG